MVVTLRLQSVKAVLFDLDGTLVDSQSIVRAFKEALESGGLRCDSANVTKMIGLPLEDLFSNLEPHLSKSGVWKLFANIGNRSITIIGASSESIIILGLNNLSH